jgi:uncharacterized protein YegL
MARPEASVRSERPPLTVFAVDVSESTPRSAEPRTLALLRDSWNREVSAGHRAALVVFAGRALAVRAPSSAHWDVEPWRVAPRTELARLAAEAESDGSDGRGAAQRIASLRAWMDSLDPDASDLGRAAAAARALFQEDATNRIVLFTDGRDTTGAGFDPPPGTFLVRLDDPSRTDAAVADVQAPLTVRSGEPFDVRVTIGASRAGEIQLSLAVDDAPVPEAARSVRLAGPGRAVVTLENLQQKRAFAPGLRSLRVLVRQEGDEEPRNNAGFAAVTVTGKPRVLLVERRRAGAEALAGMLAAQDIDFERGTPARLTGPLDEFAAVVLAGLSREEISPPVVSALSSYLSSGGGGLWVVGSPDLRGPQGYAGTEFERLLPVAFAETPSAPAATGPDPKPAPAPPPPAPAPGEPRQALAPPVAILFVIDKSGSMAGTPIEIVKASCIQSAKNLTGRDVVGVLAFDLRPRWVLEFTDADRREYIDERVRRLFADGSTHIAPALDETLRMLRADPRARRASARHVILLSDGDSLPGDFETPVRKLAEEGVTVSTVCVGSGPKFDAPLMAKIAEWGQGRFLFADSFKSVPEIFAQEVRKAAGRAPKPPDPPPLGRPPTPPDPKPAPEPNPGEPKEPPFAVVVKDPHEVLQGLESKAFPLLRGRLAAKARPGAELPLATRDGEPVLALWRVGLGKAAVWTSDLSGAWSDAWVAWPEASKLFAQLVRSLSSAAPDAELAARVRTTARGNRAGLRVEPGPDGESLAAQDAVTGRPMPLGVESDGTRSLEAALDQSGRILPVRLHRPDGKGLVVGLVRSCDAEHAPSEAAALPWTAPGDLERSLGAARMSADRRLDLSLWGILAVLVLLPVDVALRRIRA